MLDTISIPLAAIAGTAVVVSTAVDLDPIVTWSLAIIAGGGTAAAVSSGTATTRATSTATTAGVANPLISTAELGTAAALSGLAIYSPIIAILVVIVVLVILFFFLKKIIKLFTKKTK